MNNKLIRQLLVGAFLISLVSSPAAFAIGAWATIDDAIWDFSQDQLNAQVGEAVSATGDFNNDGMFDCLDADALVAEIAGATDAVEFDLNGDGAVNGDDLTAWLAQAGAENLMSGNSYLIGDANLDGTVDGQDFLAWNANKFTATASWCGGDFNADGIVDGMDFVLWNANKFQSANATVPEPQLGLVGLLMTSVLLWRRRRQRGH